MVCYRGFILHKENDLHVGVKWNSDAKVIAEIKAKSLKELMHDIDFYNLKHEYKDFD